MLNFIVQYEGLARLFCFLAVLLVLLLCESFFPRRNRDESKRIRVFNNLSLAFLNNFILRLVFPFLAFGASLLAWQKEWGLFHQFYISSYLEIPLSILLLDFIIYGQHVAFHRIPFLWRLHRVHHADIEVDVSTGIRFHVIEIIISMGIKIGCIFLIGASPVSVFLFELILTLLALFNHSNINLPFGLDRVLRRWVVTPDMHRVHHSVHSFETNSNYGFNFPWWDRFFGTYRSQPVDGHREMKLGLHIFREKRWNRLDQILYEPFTKK